MSRGGVPILAPALALAFGLAATEVSAQSGRGVYSGDWRQQSRPRLDQEAARSRFAGEVRFGPYYPKVDDEFGGKGPYAQVFGESPRLYFGLELDWKIVRIPFVGPIGPGFGWGYTRASAKAKVQGGNTESGSDTGLWIMPMHVSAVLRVDEIARRTVIPIVPYAKLGLGVALWGASAAGENVTVDGVAGEGSSTGLHTALGLMLGLSWLDRSAQAAMRNASGIYEAYVFGEWMNASLGNSNQMRVGTSTWVVGLAFDF